MPTSELSRKRCTPCEGGTPPLPAEDLPLLLAEVPQWSLAADGRHVRRRWKMTGFVAALDFFRRVGDVAEAEGHHPDLHLTGYRDVAIEITTHAAGGLTLNDFILAAKIDELPAEAKG